MAYQVAHLYKITNKQTGEYYVGKHNGDTQKKAGGGLYWGSGDRIKNQVKKYGKDNFKYEILVISNQEYIYELEQKYVTQELINEDSLCLNLMTGGEGSRTYSEESKRKISESLKGRTMSKETKEKLSKLKKGNSYAFGHKHTNQAKDKLRQYRSEQIIDYTKISKTMSTLTWMNDGKRSYRIRPENVQASKEKGMVEGRLTNYVNDKYKEKLSMTTTQQWQKAKGV